MTATVTAPVENQTDADEQVQRAEKVVRELAALGRAELEADQAEREAAAEAEAARKAAARRAVMLQIKAAIVAEGSIPTELFPFMKPCGLDDDGGCRNGYVTICVYPPGAGENNYVAVNVVRTPSPEPGHWYVPTAGPWIGPVPGGTQGFSTFTRALAAAMGAGPDIPF